MREGGGWVGVRKLKLNIRKKRFMATIRRMWQWWAQESISLSAVALYGVKYDVSKIVAPVPEVWLEAIELIPVSEAVEKNLREAPYVKAE